SSSLTADVINIIDMSPTSNFVHLNQLIPNSDGSYEFSFTAGGVLWKLNGDYTIQATYGADTSEITINYVGGEQVISTPTPEPTEPKPTEPEPTEPEPTEPEPTCGAGTELVNGICQVITTSEPESQGGGCLIATAAYGTELAPQVQFLREIRDNTLMSTASGTAFMTGFNQLYYSFSPTIADMERENPMFQEAVRVFITPMISTLSIMTLAEDGSEVEVLGLGISVIALNLGMYIAVPALIGFKVHNHFKSRN
ncbi:MAG: hypothetical protein IIB02_02305, partial [Thaumarchaeota archaeon]|nr:hypothetical protein [Nitrososphaerota archaeon]